MTRQGDVRVRFTRLAAAVRLEMGRLRSIVAEAEEALTDFATDTPRLRELRGVGDIVHDFYTGIERIFEKIAPELNGGVPAGPASHRELLDNMTLDLPQVRPAVITRATAGLMAEFLRFRHLFRNLYGFELEWPRLHPLLTRLPTAWRALEDDLRRFLEFLDAAARS